MRLADDMDVLRDASLHPVTRIITAANIPTSAPCTFTRAHVHGGDALELPDADLGAGRQHPRLLRGGLERIRTALARLAGRSDRTRRIHVALLPGLDHGERRRPRGGPAGGAYCPPNCRFRRPPRWV